MPYIPMEETKVIDGKVTFKNQKIRNQRRREEMEKKKILKKTIKEHLLKEQEFLIKQLELINEESCNATGRELSDLTNAMCLVLKEMSIPYALRSGIFTAVFFNLLIGLIVLVKKFFRSQC